MSPGCLIFDPCYCCGKLMKYRTAAIYTSDGQPQWVGLDCYKHIVSAGKIGFQPKRGGPKLFKENPNPDAYHGIYGIGHSL